MRPAQRLTALLLLVGMFLMPPAAAASSDKNVIKIGSDYIVEKGQKVHNVITLGGQITVNGTVDKNVLAVGGSVVLTRTAMVRGDVVSLGGVIVMARDAEVGGDLTEINSSNLLETVTAAVSSEWEGWSWIFAVISISIFLVILVLALLISALLPKPVRIVSEAIRENTFKVVLCGLLGVVLPVPLALLLTLSVVGITLIPLEIIIVVCSVLLGFIAVGQMLGARFLRLLRRPRTGIVRETFWGLLLLWMIGWIPYIGVMIKVLAIVIGLGAVLLSRFGTYRGWVCVPQEPPPLDPPPAASPPPDAPRAEPPVTAPPAAAPATAPAEPPAPPPPAAPPAGV